MRLLHILPNQDLVLVGPFRKDAIPPYAILSHTWLKDDEEVSFEDMENGRGRDKIGFEKIRLCAAQATNDGLSHIWVDTCCIRKSSDAELSEALISMYRWYGSATRCYAFLSDVPWAQTQGDPTLSCAMWEDQFRRSKWFTRGWTLPELLAPRSVTFFSYEGVYLGDKAGLAQVIGEITQISLRAIQGAELSGFSVDERFGWARSRLTTREEDLVYSLMGIFSVSMSVLYGEGKTNALKRLRAELGLDIDRIERLPSVAEAAFNSYASQHEPTCLKGTRVELLQTIHKWADDRDQQPLFWLNGLAGTGKSTISRTVARNYFDRQQLGASFFFSKGGGDVGHAGKFVSTIAAQLAGNIPTLRQHVSDAISQRPDIVTMALKDQWQHLVLGPLSKIVRSNLLTSFVVVVDALDECDDDLDIRVIIELLRDLSTVKQIRLLVLLTSRPEVPIRLGFRILSADEHRGVELHSIAPLIVNSDIHLYLETTLKTIGAEAHEDDGWPTMPDLRRLVQKASGLFVWASTACRFVDGGFAADENLQLILSNDLAAEAGPEIHLNQLYLTVLQKAMRPNFSQQGKTAFLSLLRSVMGAIVTMFSPLSIRSLGELLAVTDRKISQVLHDLHAIFAVPDDRNLAIRLHHPSLRDFLLDKSRCSDLRFYVDEQQLHRTIAERCIEVMSKNLKQDVCNVSAPGTLVADVDSDLIERAIPAELQYACTYWVAHVDKSSWQFQNDDRVHTFIASKLLYWIEALAWMGQVYNAVTTLLTLKNLVDDRQCPELAALLEDARRFVLFNQNGIEQSPLQIYCSSLVFTPKLSLVRKRFEHLLPAWISILPEVPDRWSSILQTIEYAGDRIETLSFSQDANWLASISTKGHVKVYDLSSGRQTFAHIFSRDHGRDIALSPSGMFLAVSSDSAFVSPKESFPGGKDFSVFDTITGRVKTTILSYAKHLTFSPNGTLAAANYDGPIRLWDVDTGVALPTTFNTSDVLSFGFSITGDYLISSGRVSVHAIDFVIIWNAKTGDKLRTFSNPSTLAFSPCGMLLVVAAPRYEIFNLIDLTANGIPLILMDEDSRIIDEDYDGGLFFLPSGALASSRNGTIRIWDASTRRLICKRDNLWDMDHHVYYSPNRARAAVNNHFGQVAIWDMSSLEADTTSTATSTGDTQISSSGNIEISPDSRYIAIPMKDGSTCLRQLDTSSSLVLEGHGPYDFSLTFSNDSKSLAVATRETPSSDTMIDVWDLTSSHPPDMESLSRSLYLGAPGYLSKLAFSPNDRFLAMVGGTGLFLYGRCHKTKYQSVYQSAVPDFAFSPDSTRLVFCQKGRGCRLLDLTNMKESNVSIERCSQSDYLITGLAFSPDGKLFASTDYAHPIAIIWDTATGDVLQTIKVSESYSCNDLHFSRDSALLKFNNNWYAFTQMTQAEADAHEEVRDEVYLRDNWFCLGSTRVLRPPPQYSPGSIIVRGNIVAFNTNEVPLVVLRFDFDKLHV